MLKRGHRDRSAARNGLSSVLGEGSQLVGDLRVQGSIRIDGELDGRLTARDAVVVGRTGWVRADLRAREIVVSGRVEGKLIAEERVELQAGARVEGDMWAQTLVVAEGVFYRGNCCMGEEARGVCRSLARESETPGADAGSARRRDEPSSLTVVDALARRFR